MKPGVIDTNLLLYAVNKDAAEHPASKAFLESARTSRETWYLTDGIVYEFFRVATHPKIFPKPLDWKESLEFIEGLLTSENFQRLQPSEIHWETLQKVLERLTHPCGNLFFDIRTATLMLEHGIRQIYSTDTDFLQFADLDVVNPLKPPSSAAKAKRS
jgi:toxin-antitoxin system PIN domain toxin